MGDGGSMPTTPGADGSPVTWGAACELTQQVNANLTLSATQCAVYHAANGLAIGGTSSPVLTVGPGVAIAFGPGTQLLVGDQLGGLVLQGTATLPVVFTSDASTPKAGDWGGVEFKPQTLPITNLTNLIMHYGGHSVNNLPYHSVPASFFVAGQNGDFAVTLSNVRVAHNAGTAFAFVGAHTGPASNSSGTLTATNWGSSGDPFLIDPDAASMLSVVQLSVGSATNGYVNLDSPVHSLQVDTTQTWPSIAPLTYVIGESTYGNNELDIVPNGATTTTTLTVAAPNTVRLGSHFVITVDPSSTALAAIQANATASAPIAFESLSGAAQPGEWDGLVFNYNGPGLPSALTNVTVDSAGEVSGYGTLGAILTIGEGPGSTCVPGPTLSGITFKNLPATSYGIVALDVTGSTATTYSTGNVFGAGALSVYTTPESSGDWQCN
jgi:hypothetical protein